MIRCTKNKSAKSGAQQVVRKISMRNQEVEP